MREPYYVETQKDGEKSVECKQDKTELRVRSNAYEHIHRRRKKYCKLTNPYERTANVFESSAAFFSFLLRKFKPKANLIPGRIKIPNQKQKSELRN